MNWQEANPERKNFKGMEVVVKRKSHCTRMGLQIQPTANSFSLHIRTNLSTRWPEILDFIQTHQDWIERQKIKMQKKIAYRIGESLLPGSKLLYLGEEKELTLLPSLMPKAYYQMREKEFQVLLPHAEFLAAQNNPQDFSDFFRLAYCTFLKNRAQMYIGPRCVSLAEIKKLPLIKVSIRKQKSRWGSCSRNGHISLNQNLMVFNLETIDYVILHELAHLVHMNHSTAFWDLLSSWCPNYKTYEKNLKSTYLGL